MRNQEGPARESSHSSLQRSSLSSVSLCLDFKIVFFLTSFSSLSRSLPRGRTLCFSVAAAYALCFSEFALFGGLQYELRFELEIIELLHAIRVGPWLRKWIFGLSCAKKKIHLQ